MTTVAADLDAFGECFRRNGSPRPRERLIWQYVDNPAGRVYVDVADVGGHFAAIYASLPVNLRIDGVVRLGLQSLDTLTDESFRGKGLFISLARSLFDRALQDDIALIYGFPNGNSAHGFYNRLEWAPLDPLPLLVRPLRSRYILTRLGRARPGLLAWLEQLPDIRIPTLPVSSRDVVRVRTFDEGHTRLWHRFAAGIRVATERDAMYMNWRITEKPGEDYHTHALADRDGNVSAYVTYTVKEKHEGTIGYVMELLHAPDREGDARRLLQVALASMAQAGADLALAWCPQHAPNRRAYRASGFVTFPLGLRPLELHVGARGFDEALQSVVLRRENWYFSYLDSDTV